MKLTDLISQGKPILLTAASGNGARMMALEAFWKIGKEPRVMDMEFMDPSDVTKEWASFRNGDAILVLESKNSSQETQESLGSLMNDPDKIVVVADSEPPSHLKPEMFAHWAKF